MIGHRTRLDADSVAIAFVAAARLTGEDPTTIAQRTDMRCRHLALHALVHCFRDVAPSKISKALGAPGKASYFYRSSLWYTLGQAPQHTVKKATWWRDEDLASVIDAVEKHLSDLTPKPPTKRAMLVAKDAGVTKTAPVVESRKPDRPLPESKPPGPVFRPSPGGINPGKRALYEMLGEAARNTAKLPKE